MAFNFSKLNKANGVRPENFNTDGFDYTHIREYAGRDLPVKGFFFTNSRKGRQVVIITDDCLVNMPGRAVEEFEALESDPEAVKAVLNGELVLTDIVYPVKTKSGNDTTIYNFANAEDLNKAKKAK